MLRTVSKIQNVQLCNISPTSCALSQLCDDLQLRSGYGIEGRFKGFTIQTIDTWISEKGLEFCVYALIYITHCSFAAQTGKS